MLRYKIIQKKRASKAGFTIEKMICRTVFATSNLFKIN